MNELMIVIKGGQWIYYTTACKTAESALREFNTALSATGINIDNVIVEKVVLRDGNQNDIDSLKLGGVK